MKINKVAVCAVAGLALLAGNSWAWGKRMQK